ncbi:uncharacterized protein BYT42DRAFT_574562 [Radiomyces spectabilis]|uniref:uncharacterized protein n=1 Tax=Radiomyces spectabilis TaxID=64574 RepID=UPI00221ED63A|nr:uncharacterized protein BYT42DRAFT_574562 [Radiomyces spectabilis]KAI8376430.1 hypothetical protein BYT42DRAFT_574562 [Radiomyces spectabilis]
MHKFFFLYLICRSSRMVESMQLPPPKPSSLLLKRLAPKHGKTPQLTIFTPSYAQNHHAAIHSAPLRPMVATQRVKPNKIVKRQPSSRLPPKTASAITAPYKITEFPSPPIVPSQQPATSTATSTSVHRPSSASNAAHAAAAAAAAAATAAAAASATAYRFNVAHSSVPKTPAPLTQKQQFLRPFEFLYDNIEHTQTLKATLDDQIRRSSTLIRSLQSSGTMIESLVRRQVREMVDQEFDDKLADCVERIHALEQRLQLRDAPLSPKHSPSPSPPGQPASDKQPMIREMFSELMNRLDQLENKMAPTVAS